MRRVHGLAGVVALVGLWWLLAVTLFADGGAVPTPWQVLAGMARDGWAFYGPNVTSTVGAALQGFLWGNGLAIAVAMLVLLVPRLEAVATQLAVISYCIPLLAIGPIILVVFGGPATVVFLAAVSVFFTTLIGALLGLRSADRASLDVVTVYGGGRLARLRYVQVIAALPSTFAGLRISAPSALLGAIIGEYLGSDDQGLGVSLMISQQQFQVPRTWGLALVAGLVAGLGYAAVALVARVVTPWSSGRTESGSAL
ncbi:ABC transporter permease [Nonomuraea rhodomycinica]|uniref:ABC transporter permease subunit n=1 Tax=Nonomuraea rhodomycinica TaxID=1712872 RepID=A0A7Y6IW56_9ACTN|nr:ABC transporter permease subunit [Nonomuraea rhodomycinica]NUW45270.1 ABC transporter permease subunit [Nonomuraea rhodomycinica]